MTNSDWIISIKDLKTSISIEMKDVDVCEKQNVWNKKVCQGLVTWKSYIS